ncbi:sugar phosphate isomerase/epimerase family protein [Halomicrobium urmianum]|uniref:sugar phosphate isomerase/epimerase family protein n=1 Tax=Halomicrobium urmianum TaxID=1586233 RepID=UPI001CD9231B|nr:sugar phosphate isomerase/epimerase [Halomicrobium urmianum]
MTRSAIQLYTLRNVDRPFTEVLELVADAGFDGVEFAYRVPDADVDAVVATLEETGLSVAGAHVGIDDLEDDFEDTVALYEALGVENVVIPWLDAEHFESREAASAAAERLEALADRLADRGMTLHYHNHDHEYVDLDGETGFDAFVDATDFGIELDLGLALHAGDDPVARLRPLGDRSELIHLKDFDRDAGESVPVGEGDLDLDGVADAAATNDSDWIVYEYEGEDPVETLEAAADTVRDLC